MTRSKAQEYSELARACRTLARTVSTEDGRSHLAAMAEVWERLAHQQAQGSDPNEAPARPSGATGEPVVQQQQQQVQRKDEDKDN